MKPHFGVPDTIEGRLPSNARTSARLTGTPSRALGRWLGMLMFIAASAVHAAAVVDVYKSADCGCCTEWVKHLRDNGFQVRAHDVPDPGVYRQKFGLSDELGGCHTAVIADAAAKPRISYVIEGHVPAREIRRLIKEQPKALGLTVPGMPAGSPGMEGPVRVPYNVLLVDKSGSHRVYQKY